MTIATRCTRTSHGKNIVYSIAIGLTLSVKKNIWKSSMTVKDAKSAILTVPEWLYRTSMQVIACVNKP